MFSIPCLLQFMNATENLRLSRAQFSFSDDQVSVEVFSNDTKIHALSIDVDCCHLDWQVSSAAQIFNALSQKFSAVEHLTFKDRASRRSSEEHIEADRAELRKLLGSFGNVKTLRIPSGRLVGEFSRCLRLDDGESPLELLPKLQELTFPEIDDVNGAFTQFIDARENAGRPVTLTRR